MKGGRYWRFENDVLDSGFPKVIKAGFGGLQGHITAALSVPQYRSRRESVYFFKRGAEMCSKTRLLSFVDSPFVFEPSCLLMDIFPCGWLLQGDLSRNTHTSLAPVPRVAGKSIIPFTQFAAGQLDKQVTHR